MPAQLDVNAAGVADVFQRTHHLGEVDFSLVEHQMVVDAAAHVLDVDVPQPLAPAPHLIRDGGFSQAMQMANVDGEAEEGMIDPPRNSA